MEYLKYDDTELDEDSLRKVKEELKETEEKRKICMDSLRKKLQDTENLNPCLDDVFLLGYLRVAKFDYIKAYKRIVNYYDEKWNQPNIAKDYYPSSVKIVETARKVFVSPYRAKDSSAILIVRRGDYDPSKVPYDLILRAFAMFCELLLQHPLNQMCGCTFILDLKTNSWGTWSELTPARLKLISRLVQKILAMRIRAIHIVNAPPIYFFLYSIVYPFLSIKMRNRIFLHKNFDSLHTYIDPEILPEEYHGCLEHSNLINLYERLYEMEDFFRKFSKYGYMKKK